jgi:hypothetical protein
VPSVLANRRPKNLLTEGENAMSVIDLDSSGMLISNGQEMSALFFVAWMVLGLVTGFIGQQNSQQVGSPSDSLCSVKYCRRNRWRFSIQSAWETRCYWFGRL